MTTTVTNTLHGALDKIIAETGDDEALKTFVQKVKGQTLSRTLTGAGVENQIRAEFSRASAERRKKPFSDAEATRIAAWMQQIAGAQE